MGGAELELGYQDGVVFRRGEQYTVKGLEVNCSAPLKREFKDRIPHQVGACPGIQSPSRTFSAIFRVSGSRELVHRTSRF